MYPILLKSVLVSPTISLGFYFDSLIHWFICFPNVWIWKKEDQALLVDVIFYISVSFYIQHSFIYMCEIYEMFMYLKSKSSTACIEPSDFLSYAMSCFSNRRVLNVWIDKSKKKECVDVKRKSGTARPKLWVCACLKCMNL